jgi:predicted MPP superfamily phosphohydrolase
MGLFLLTFFTIYGGAHLYVFLKARAAFQFGLKAGIPLGLFMLAMVLAPIIVRVTERQGFELFARFMSHLGYVWLGVLFLFFSASLAMDLYRLTLYLGGLGLGQSLSALMPSHRASFFIPIAFSLLAAGYGYFEARDIRMERVTIRTPRLPAEIGTLRVAQISDLHLGLIVRQRRLRAVVDMLRAEKPDMLVSTGDLVDGQINSLPGLAELLRELEPRYGKYAVTGNHEFYAGLKEALEFTGRAGFRVLRGEGLTVEGLINIAGMDDPTRSRFEGSEATAERQVLSSLPREKFTLLLKHRPRVEEGSLGLFDLQLSGHTHKGQLFPFRLLTRIFYRHVSGLYGLSDGSALYVSGGTGTWGPPVRFLSPPEITVVELVPAKS